MYAMKATSIVVIACLTATPIAGCATVHGPREADATQSGMATTRNWSRVAELAPAAWRCVSRSHVASPVGVSGGRRVPGLPLVQA